MKVVYGNFYFACAALDEVPSHVRQVYVEALKRLSTDFRHNAVKVTKDLRSVTLLWYPDLDTHAHPYLQDSLLIPLDTNLEVKHRVESKDNPVILHRLEAILAQDDPRRAFLTQLTSKEEEAGLLSSEYAPFIGRRRYWNQLCRELGLHESLAPGCNQPYVQLDLFNESDVPIAVRREATAIARAKPSAPTRWAFNRDFITPIVFDWGCGRGRDSKWLRNLGIEVISYDPFYNPKPAPQEADFQKVNTILLNYVLNIVETSQERREILDEIHDLAQAGTMVIVSTRNKDEIEQKAKDADWRRLNDGYLTSRNTFQKGFTLEELSSLCHSIGRIVESTKIYGGVVCALFIAK